MKLNKYKKPTEVRLSALLDGDCFEFDNRVYILTDSIKTGLYGCVVLNTGLLVYLGKMTYVTPVAVEATVSY